VDLLAEAPMPRSSLTSRVAYRVAEQPGWRLGRPSGDPTAQWWMRLEEGGGEDTLALALLVDAAAPVVLEIGTRGSTTVELTLYVRRRPRPGWLACRANTRFLIDGYHDEDFEIWDADGEVVAQSRQLARAAMGTGGGSDET
jgi:acyl-CoA thioesterase